MVKSTLLLSTVESLKSELVHTDLHSRNKENLDYL